MKVFDLICGAGHRFEGWFASAEQFSAQCDALEIHCPTCESGEIRREPSASRLNLGGDVPVVREPKADASALLDRLRRLVAQTEDVGTRFAEEARRIHYEEIAARPIRGTATDRERRDLHDEGIETLNIPIPRVLTETMQ
ncbi:MAG: DUF1178 family protein [Burkholderiaceae bacterium]